MTAPKLVYLVTSGEYSDYRINGAYSTRKLAQRVADANNTGGGYLEYSVEEYALDMAADAYAQGLAPYEVRMGRDGDAHRVATSGPQECFGPAKYEIRMPLNPAARYPSSIVVTCWARDETHAIKIANDIRAQSIAAGEWDKVTP